MRAIADPSGLLLGAGSQLRLFGATSQLVHVCRRVRGRRSFVPESSFHGPHKPQVPSSHSPRPIKAVRVEDASVSQDYPGLELQQRRLRFLFDSPPAPDVALPSSAHEVLERMLQSQGASTSGRDGQTAAPEQLSNAIVPAAGSPVRKASGVQAVQPLQQQQPLADPASKPRGRRKASALGSAVEADQAPPAPLPEAAAALAQQPKPKRGRPRIVRDTTAASSSSPLLLQGQPAPAAAAVEQPRAVPGRRRATKAAAAASSAAADTACCDLELAGMLSAVEQLAAAAGIPSTSEEQPAAQPSRKPRSRRGSAAASGSSASSSSVVTQAELAPSVAAPAHAVLGPAAAAAPAALVPSTRATAAPSSPPRSRRSRLLLSALRRRRGALSGTVVAAALQAPLQDEEQQQQAQQVQLSEGERDAAYLTKMREALQRGRRKKRSASGVSGSISMFLGRLGDTPVLGKEQEMRLARILHKGSRIQASIGVLASQLGRAPTPAEVMRDTGVGEAEVARRLHNREEAKDLLLQYNLRLVVHIAKRYANQGVELSDLIQEGELGLRKSIERYDPERGFRFSTYAHWYIRQPISRAVSEQGRDVRLPVHVCEMLTKIHRMEQALNKDPSRREPATREEVARALGLPLPRLLHYLRLARAPRVVSERGEGATLMTTSMKELTLDEQWEDEEFTEQVEGANWHEHMKHNVSFILSTLPKRERNILRMRFGLLQQGGEGEGGEGGEGGGAESAAGGGYALNSSPYLPGDGAADAAGAAAGGGGMMAPQDHLQQCYPSSALPPGPLPPGTAPQELSLTEVSYAYGLSKERIRQIEDRALRALRNPWRVRLLHEINNGNRLSAGTLAHLQAAARAPRRGGSGSGGGSAFS